MSNIVIKNGRAVGVALDNGADGIFLIIHDGHATPQDLLRIYERVRRAHPPKSTESLI